MGRIYTTSGVEFSMGNTGNTAKTDVGTAVVGFEDPNESRVTQFIQGGAVGTPGTFTVDSPDNNIKIESDGALLKVIMSQGSMVFTYGGTGDVGVFRFIGQGTTAELDAEGNLNIAGELGTGVSF